MLFFISGRYSPDANTDFVRVGADGGDFTFAAAAPGGAVAGTLAHIAKLAQLTQLEWGLPHC